MKPRPDTSTRLRRNLVVLSLIVGTASLLFHIQRQVIAQSQIQVTAADPSSSAQGTVNLNVRVTGKGFKSGNQAKWFVTGTNDTGGVTVNSTTFVSSTELTANISISDTAVIANFDIQVLASDGRGGKGTELFAVTAKGGGNALCPAMQPAPVGDTKCYDLTAGCLDSTFANVGYAHLDPYPPYASSADTGMDVVVQPDQKVVIAGKARISSTDIDFAVIRYNSDGTLDTSFGQVSPSNPPSRLGYTVTSVSTGFDYAYALALQPDGKIVVVGTAGSTDRVAVRYNADGTLDTTFGIGGIANFGSGPSSDVAIQSDGKIVIGGAASAGGFGLVRLNPSGSLDSSFGSGGFVTFSASGAKRGSSSGAGVAIQRVPAVTGEERIVLVGSSKTFANPSSAATNQWTMARFRSNGAIDTTFGSSGVVKTTFFGFDDKARVVKIDANNRIVVGGLVRSYSPSCGDYILDSGVARYLQDGGLDGSFGGGRQVVDVYGGSDFLYGMAVQADGRVVLFQSSYSSDSSVHNMSVARLNANGSRDLTFGPAGNGIVTLDAYGYGTYAFADLALSPIDGRIVVSGAVNLGVSGPSEILVARYWP